MIDKGKINIDVKIKTLDNNIYEVKNVSIDGQYSIRYILEDKNKNRISYTIWKSSTNEALFVIGDKVQIEYTNWTTKICFFFKEDREYKTLIMVK